MAKERGRTFGQLSVDIWDAMVTAEFGRDARQLFPVLLAQRKLSLCGLLEFRIKIWAKLTLMTPAEIEAALAELDAAGWIVVDWDTDELVIPGIVRKIQATNWKTVKGMWSAHSRVESADLRQVVIDNLPDGCPPSDAEPPTPGAKPADPASDRPIEGATDRPIDPTSDPTRDLILETGNSSSSSAKLSTGADPEPPANHDDDDDPAAAVVDPEDRASEVCDRIGDADYALAVVSGQPIKHPTRFRQACLANAWTSWHQAALGAAREHPTWTTDQIIDHVTGAGDDPAGRQLPAPPPAARGHPTTTLTETTTVVEIADNGAPVVDLAAHRARHAAAQ